MHSFEKRDSLKKRLAVGAASICLALGLGLGVDAGERKSGHGATSKPADHVAASTKKKHGKETKNLGGGHAAWGYSGKTGPEKWGDLAPANRVCKTGKGQSPIDLRPATSAKVEDIKFNYKVTQLSILHNGHTVQVNYAPGSYMIAEGKRYDLLQFHFHTPSEHSAGGQRADVEMHLVHKSADGQLAVVGVMMDAGGANLALGEIWQFLPKSATPARKHENTLINVRDLLPEQTRYYRYVGSLTTPPCSEGVQWFVMQQRARIPRAMVAKLAKAVGPNARPVQALNNRLLISPIGNN